MALPLAPEAPPVVCPICGRPAVAVFSLDNKTAPQCAVHGYIVLAQFGARVIKVLDPDGWERLVDALEWDGHPVPALPN